MGNEYYQNLIEKIEEKNAVIGIIGLDMSGCH